MLRKLFLLLFIIPWMGCINNSVEPEIITTQVSFSDDVRPIFVNSCNSCHAAGQNGFNSGSYSGVINSTSATYGSDTVIPGDADNSPLVDKIEPNPQRGARMPQGGALSAEQIATIRAWIDQGALNN